MGFKLLSFRGGTRPPGNKHFTKNKNIEKAKVPALVYIPLKQHVGAPCEAVVKPGDQVKMGQVIGKQMGFISVPIHSSVSGKVKSIIPFPIPQGNKEMTVVIENDGLDTLDDSIKPRDINALSADEIRNIILDAGIVGLGSATFPTHVKLSPPADKHIDTVILNGAECESYLTTDDRIMIEQADEVVAGLRVIMGVLDVKMGYIGIESNKPEAIAAIEKVIGNESNIRVKVLKDKYPQGCERKLIETITGRQIPSGGLPMDVGVIVNNVGTAAQIYKSIITGMPLIEKVITVSGRGVENPRNLLVRIGTLLEDLIDDCGGYAGDPGKVIIGGPMMGMAQHSLEVPVTKCVSGIVVLPKEEVKDEEILPCIRCGKCVEVCPIHLMPLHISAYSLKGDYESCKKFNALDCVECGSCSYICPAKRPLQHSIKVAKEAIIAENKGKASGDQ
ncbi:MAG: electron transport complex subunit RsxC [Clostridiales bacterium]|nr:electron transport complex subunit RsxC [Clostridiales bacterium]